MKYLAVLLRQSVRVNHSPADSAYQILVIYVFERKLFRDP